MWQPYPIRAGETYWTVHAGVPPESPTFFSVSPFKVLSPQPPKFLKSLLPVKEENKTKKGQEVRPLLGQEVKRDHFFFFLSNNLNLFLHLLLSTFLLTSKLITSSISILKWPKHHRTQRWSLILCDDRVLSFQIASGSFHFLLITYFVLFKWTKSGARTWMTKTFFPWKINCG